MLNLKSRAGLNIDTSDHNFPRAVQHTSKQTKLLQQYTTTVTLDHGVKLPRSLLETLSGSDEIEIRRMARSSLPRGKSSIAK